MLSTRLCGALLCAAALAPLTAGSRVADAQDWMAPLGPAIAAQGNQALRDIRHEAREQPRAQKPAPLEDLLVQVRSEAAPDDEPLEI